MTPGFAALTEDQLLAVQAPAAPVMVLAGPGTGKTRTLVARLVFLVQELGIDCSRICAVTYTNKATEQMRERVRLALGEAAAELSIGTFHAFCIGTLREHAEEAGLPSYFTVADEEFQLEMLHRAVPAIQSGAALRTLLGKISRAALRPEHAEGLLSPFEREAEARYRGLLRENCVIDFDDILVLTWRLLDSRAEIARDYRERYGAIVIDEFQDTDAIQYQIFRSLAAAHRNIFAVADDDQSIFSWRGAHPRNIAAFIADFPEARVVRLARTFRSTPQIVELASRLMKGRGIAPKSLATIRDEGEPPSLRAFDSEFEEARFIAEEIGRRRSANPGLKYRDFAVLYARHTIGDLVQQALAEQSHPAQLVRSKGFFDSPRMNHLLAMLRALRNPKDDLAVERLAQSILPELEFTAIQKRARGSAGQSFRASLGRALKQDGLLSPDAAHLKSLLRQIQNMRSTIRRRRTTRVSDIAGEFAGALSIGRGESFISESQPPITRLPEELKDAAAAINRKLGSGADVHVACIDPVQQRLLQMVGDRAARLCAPHSASKKGTRAEAARSIVFVLSNKLLEESVRNAAAGDVIVTVEPGIERETSTLRESDEDGPAIIEVRSSAKSASQILFELLRQAAALKLEDDLSDYTCVDVETTDVDVSKTEIIELAAVRVRDGKPVDEALFQFKPDGKISAGAAAVHGISEESLRDCPSFRAEVSEVARFLGTDLLVAHNGYEFDFPLLNRQVKEATGRPLQNPVFDSLLLARRLFPHEGASIDALVSKFALNAGSRHRALDDSRVLAQIFERLKEEELMRRRAQVLSDESDKLVLAMKLELGENPLPQEPCYKKGLTLLLTSGAGLVGQLREEFPGPFFSETVGSLESVVAEANVTAWRAHASEDDFELCIRLDAVCSMFDSLPAEEGIAAFLDYVSLFQSQDGFGDQDAVSLLTIYAAKGLEFSRVFVAGLEENVIPSVYAVRSGEPDRIAEQRRLLYVAITRARDELVLTWARERGGFQQSPSRFIEDLFDLKELENC